MKLNVNPNRMVLLRLRKRLNFALRGHRLLKDKLEGLIKEFTVLVKEYKKQRKRVDDSLPEVLKTFLLAKATSTTEIIEDALKGINDPKKCKVIPDRAIAIKTAISSAKPNDIVVIAGKGHEDYQVIGSVKKYFSDIEISKSTLKRLGYEGNN